MKKVKVGILSPFNKRVLGSLNKKLFDFIDLDLSNNNVILKDISCLILDTRILSKSFYAKLKNLKLICRFGVGIENLDLNFLKRRKINLSITKKSIVNPVAEHAIGFILLSIKSYNEFNKLIKANKYENQFEYPKIMNLENKEVLIIGLGNIGKRISNILEIFNCRISFYDPHIKNYKNLIKINKLSQNLGKYDVISINTSLNKYTKKIINYSNLKFFKEGTIIVNTSRGGIVDEKALIKLSAKKKIIYCSDVFEKEPLKKGFELSKYDRNSFTPHVSTSSSETRLAMSEEVIQNLKDYFIRKKKNQNFLI